MSLTVVKLLRLQAEGLLSSADVMILNLLAGKENLSQREIARRLDIPESSLRDKIKRIRATIDRFY